MQIGSSSFLGISWAPRAAASPGPESAEIGPETGLKNDHDADDRPAALAASSSPSASAVSAGSGRGQQVNLLA